jgi:hypothetical protein
MKRKEDVRDMAQIQIDLPKVAEVLYAIRQRLDVLREEIKMPSYRFLYQPETADMFRMKICGAINEANGKLDCALNDLSDVERIFALVTQERMAELLAPVLLGFKKGEKEEGR